MSKVDIISARTGATSSLKDVTRTTVLMICVQKLVVVTSMRLLISLSVSPLLQVWFSPMPKQRKRFKLLWLQTLKQWLNCQTWRREELKKEEPKVTKARGRKAQRRSSSKSCSSCICRFHSSWHRWQSWREQKSEEPRWIEPKHPHHCIRWLRRWCQW